MFSHFSEEMGRIFYDGTHNVITLILATTYIMALNLHFFL